MGNHGNTVTNVLSLIMTVSVMVNIEVSICPPSQERVPTQTLPWIPTSTR